MGALNLFNMFILVLKQMLKTECFSRAFCCQDSRMGTILKDVECPKCLLKDVSFQDWLIDHSFFATKKPTEILLHPKSGFFKTFGKVFRMNPWFSTSILPMIHYPRHYSPWIIHREWVNRDLSSISFRFGIGIRRAFGKHKPIID